MKENLQILLLAYLRENNPDLLFQLEEDDVLHAWILEKLRGSEDVADEAVFLETVTQDLRPSKYNYLKNILENEFPQDYQRLVDTGVLVFEVVGMIGACNNVFEKLPLTDDADNENEGDRMRRYEVIGIISDCLVDTE